MKKIISTLLLSLGLIFVGNIQAQTTQKVQLEQTPGEFSTKELKLEAGQSYVFEVTNKGVDHEVGFVIAPKGNIEQGNHIKEAYISKMVGNGETASSQEVVLQAGTYVYFCPMNPTPQYEIHVE